MVSTRGRYAIRVMIDLAEYDDGHFIPLKDIALRQQSWGKRTGNKHKKWKEGKRHCIIQ